MFDTIEQKSIILQDEPELIVNEDFIMSWFDVFYQELPLFLNYKNYPHDGKNQHRLVKYALKHLPRQELRSELFNSSDLRTSKVISTWKF